MRKAADLVVGGFSHKHYLVGYLIDYVRDELTVCGVSMVLTVR